MKTCVKCNSEYPDNFKYCQKCLTPNEDLQEGQEVNLSLNQTDKHKITIGITYAIQILSFISLVIGILILIFGSTRDSVLGSSLIGSFVFMYMLSSIVFLLVDIEKNTRK